ncbi:S8 family serine peptidase [Amycolatopsis sp. NPDC058986]|uniref:S8 family serine peptidase n=1 Tax=unclassified Amycolatopsis TaxID=2618356 RepID=UPI00366DB634
MITRAGVVALVLALTPVSPAMAQQGGECRPPAPRGQPLPTAAGPDPVIARLGFDRAHELATGAGVLAGVVDSGVDWSHPKLGGAVPAPGTQIGDQGPPGPGRALDCAGHGTAVAGLLAARPGDDPRVAGIAPGASIYPVRFATPIENLPRGQLAAGIRDAADHRVRVLNLSFALAVDDPAVRDAIAYAQARDVVVVAAAGNEAQSQPGQTWYPAAYPGVLAVAAVNAQGLPLAQSNSGPWVGIAAPGENLTTTAPGGGYLAVTGTSFATPLVTGAAALIRQRYPELPAPQVIDRLKSAAVRVSGRPDERSGAGVLDPYAALTVPDAALPSSSLRPGGLVRMAPMPAGTDDSRATRIALAWSGILASLAMLAAIGALAVRRAAKRGWAAGPLPRTAREERGTPGPPDTELV